MKDIQEIMKKMNAVADETAVTLADLGLTCTCNAPCAGTGGLSVCGAAIQTVTSTCVITIPTGFTLANAVPAIAYNVNNLRAFVEECFCTAAGTPKFDVRIVGSIPYVVNLPLSPTGICISPANTTVSLCCSGVASVDNIVGFTCDQNTALIASGIITGGLLNCTGITATISVNVIPPTPGTPIAAIVTVTFTLPGCTDPTDPV